MSNSNFNNSNKSPYSHLYENYQNEIIKDSNDKRENNPQTYYQQNKNEFISGSYNTQRNYNSQINSQNNFNKNTINKNEVVYQNKNYNENSLDLKPEFIEKLKHDINLIPNDFRDKIKFANSLFICSNILYPMSVLYFVVKEYPSISELSKKNIFFSSFIYLGFQILIKSYQNNTYEKSYNMLSSKYSKEELKKIIEQYHSMNNAQQMIYLQDLQNDQNKLNNRI